MSNIVVCPKCGKKGRLYYVRNYWIVKHSNKTSHYVPWEYIGTKIKINLARYVGGDYYLLKFIIPIVNSIKHTCYVEVFGGMGVVLFNKKPSKVEVFNDIDMNIYTLFNVVKNKPKEFIERTETILYGRQWYYEFLKKYRQKDYEDDLDQAITFFYLLYASKRACIGRGFLSSKKRNHAKSMFNAFERIKYVHRRLKNVTIECLDFRDIIKKYDSDQTLFYCDPPHIYQATEKEKLYDARFDEKDFMDLLNILENIKGKFILKHTENKFIEGWAKKKKYRIIRAKTPKYSVPLHNNKILSMTTIFIVNQKRAKSKNL